MDAPRNEHNEHSVASGDRALDDFGVVCRSRDDRHAPLERVELADAFLAAHADDLVAAIERVLHHVAPELARRSDDTDFHHARPLVREHIVRSITRLRTGRVSLPIAQSKALHRPASQR